MDKYPDKIFVTSTIMVFSVLFVIVSVIPVIGPSFAAYVLGHGQRRHKKLFGWSRAYTLISMTIGELISFIISSFIIKGAVEFYHPEVFWYLIIAGFVLNYLSSMIFYFLGDYKAKIKAAEVSKA